MLLPIEIPETERTPLVNWLLNLVAEQKQVIENQEKTIADLERKVARLEKQVKGLDEELKAAKKLKSRPKIKPSTLNQEKKTQKRGRNEPVPRKGVKRPALSQMKSGSSNRRSYQKERPSMATENTTYKI
ncbi:hypothetical protein B1L04_28960 [Microcystis aeruginosa KW]|uniref:Uncharacterized protein n=1 Tax=Microcystis aeruginosa KW TaxID=1960155 RepID=A0A1V4BLR0_MICAE|nr:hypothetical protein [Microcystis aeruginosa]OPF14625.1 hypothetical protein B1L04_28960 [Microcystis aeruginosa KW]